MTSGLEQLQRTCDKEKRENKTSRRGVEKIGGGPKTDHPRPKSMMMFEGARPPFCRPPPSSPHTTAPQQAPPHPTPQLCI
ncbi:hypothetical protein BOTBODRAFT_36785 [Botryobasidium botryosum FD-172 SS1]|uniref:Uncharacterized protein n=1 Tax=Botryobasidium botryosum (strain FD-172 SS1) TaxID=930990 RepID=A0A067M1P0_BOTB1|nr:hypothetical protein BOTBODRAFT_36785 [Botryobasidium botryosum FD-172 SS1]